MSEMELQKLHEKIKILYYFSKKYLLDKTLGAEQGTGSEIFLNLTKTCSSLKYSQNV